ncbi:flagellar type III secretion system protein FlhB [Poseidonocella sedimentorum]|uniref:Flagellar biosynthetic protein FlhB n=1 Tax=Poseidonocella sedimentorum TaxID=871652 RepID=A0A1I6D5E3_9RHOB|nr:flagellar type III secretion system protein FlhB [Poseidonocella sedimentorum]SFR00706.1 flagellar biosynthetic protein FlhB [Poseidonocella sedimentorum]
MSGDDDSAEKTLDPTPKKLEQAREKGEIVRSTDVNTAAVYGSMALVAAGFGAVSMDKIGAVLTRLIGRAPELADLFFEGSGQRLPGGLFSGILPSLSLWFIVPALAVLGSLFAQRAIVFAPSKLEPKLNRISPLSNAKNKFGRNGLFEFGKSFVKLVIYSIVLGAFLSARLDQMILAISTSPGAIAAMMCELCLQLLLIVIMVAIAIAVPDYLWQHFEHIRKNRMSRKEVMDEMKQSEGDPHMKQQRRHKGQEIALSQAIQEVPRADVVVVNPTHYAVALKWSRKRGEAPVCLAKGTDEIALRIRQIAQENGVPIHSDPPTARALHATIEIGQEIHEEHYAAVAVAIRFAERMRKKAKAQPWTI